MRKMPPPPSRRALLACCGVKLLATKRDPATSTIRSQVDLVQLKRRGAPVLYFIIERVRDRIMNWTDFVSKQEAVRIYESGGTRPEIPDDVLKALDPRAFDAPSAPLDSLLNCDCGCEGAADCPSQTTSPPEAGRSGEQHG